MGAVFSTIKPEEVSDNVFTLFGNDWPLLTAGNLNKYNSMTIGWGGLGTIWKKKVGLVLVRPQRYTFQFLEKESYFSLSFFDESYKKVLNYFGSKSGKDVDKAKETGVTPVEGEQKTVYFQEARLVLILKKIYFDDIDPNNFLGINPDDFYPGKDYHRLYIGEIVSGLIKK